MDQRKFILKETAIQALGHVICVGIMLGIFALLGKYQLSVILGGIFGGILSVANFFFMALGASIAADKATANNPKAGAGMVTGSYIVRLLLLFVICFALVKSGVCYVVTLVLPLAFSRPILTVCEFFRKPGDKKA